MSNLTDLADVCRKSGLRVIELPGWEGRGRPGSFAPRGVTCHHTGGGSDSREYAEWMARVGRSDLPAPLAQLALTRSCVVYVLAAGRANHAGTAKARGTLPAGDGNAMRVGIEAMNTGSEGWGSRGEDADGNPITQREAYVRLCAALNLGYRWDVRDTVAHRETSVTGKWDPGLLDMDDFRADVARVMKEGLEDDMQLSDKIRPNDADSPTVGQVLSRLERFIPRQDQRAKVTLAEVRDLDDEKDVTRLREKVKRLRERLETEEASA